MTLTADNSCINEKHVEKAIVDRQLEIAKQVAEINENLSEKPKFFILTLGCQQNEADSERIAGLCVMMGYERTENAEDASLIFVNTCAIREHAEERALSFIGQYKHLKDKNPDLIIGVGGCMVTQEHRSNKFKHNIPYVNFIFDTGSIHMFPELVLGAINKEKRRFIKCDDFKIAENIPLYREVPHKAWLSIMYGCNNFCSYCIVPYVRGRERSRDVDTILQEAKMLIATGAKDITLLGQNVNSYGKDIGGESIASLIRKICAIEGDFTVRFMTSHPKDASDELIKVIAEEKKVVKHFHLPVQSGSDAILKKMNRHYDSAQYKEVIDKLKAACPDISITSDIIVGFPGETEEDFQDTLDMIKYVGYDAIFSFIYSPRVGTPASEMEDRVPYDVSTERMARLLEVSNNLSLERNRRFEGRVIRVLADEVSKNDPEMLTGKADSPRPIHFKGSKDLIGQFLNVRITRADMFSMNGEIVK